MNKRELIAALRLEPHLEGGYFRRTYVSEEKATLPAGSSRRRLFSTIYYLLADDSPIGHLHRNRSAIVHYFQLGAPLTYWILEPGGRLERRVLGPDLGAGQALQLVVPGGCWKATELEAGAYGLVSEAVSPAFSYQDHELASAQTMRDRYPEHWQRLRRFIKP